MDTNRVLYFLELLTKESSGHDAELRRLFQAALDENDDVSEFRALRTSHEFYHKSGADLCGEGERLLKELYAAPTRALEILPELRQASERIEAEARICEDLMRSPTPFTDMIAVLRKRTIPSHVAALQTIAAVCVYLVLIYAGPEPIKDLTWNDAVGIQEMIYAVNTGYLPALCGVRQPAKSWIIRKDRMGGGALFGGDCFYLTYESTSHVELLCSALNRERIGTHAFLNVDAFEAGLDDVPFCWGVGNLVSVAPDRALSVLQRDIATRLRCPGPAELSRKLPAPAECMRQLSDGLPYCITPDELALAMNRWQIGHEAAVRRKNQVCLICGRHVNGNRRVCPSHFKRE